MRSKMGAVSSPPDSPDKRRRRWGTLPASTAGTVEVPRLALIVEREAGQPSERRTTIDGELCRIGSHESNDVCLEDAMVSRFHCNLVRSGAGWRLTDSGSLNGTRVNGVSIRDADLPREAVLELGESLVRIREADSVTMAQVPVSPAFGDLVGTSVVMRRMFGLLERVAGSEANLLIQGESGSGKEAIAMEIVRRGPRADRPLVIVDCGAISPTLIESELFGHTRGAFTGAERERVGAFEEADGGTVLLDEVGELPLEMQPKLLRVIESGHVRRVGENRTRSVDVRVVAATNRRLEREVNHGRFREDLFFRLSVVTVRVPPLRERLEDIPVLLNLFLQRLGAGDRRDLFTPEVMAEMARYDWPGNVRELRNYVERAVVLDEVGPTRMRSSLVPPAPTDPVDLDEPFTEAKKRVVADFEQRYLGALLSWSGGNVSQAARKAGMDRMYLHRLLQRYDIKRGSSLKD
jgi:transcriptional regulator with GAF, ATPase, and Fis domain